MSTKTGRPKNGPENGLENDNPQAADQNRDQGPADQAPPATGSTFAGPPPPTGTGPQTVRRLYRTTGPVSGVAGGLADYFSVDASLLRVALVAGTLLGGPVVPIGYIAAWLIIPQADPAPVAPIMAAPPAPAAPSAGPVPPPPAPVDGPFDRPPVDGPPVDGPPADSPPIDSPPFADPAFADPVPSVLSPTDPSPTDPSPANN